MPQPVNILHLHSTFSLGGKEARAVRLMNAFGDRARHTIVSGMPDQLGARDAIAAGISYEIAQNPPPLTGKPSVSRYEALARFMRRFDLVLTYNWGAIDGVMARRVFSKGMPPLIHHEDGFNADEASGLKIERNMYRRLALAGGARAGRAVADPGEDRPAQLEAAREPPPPYPQRHRYRALRGEARSEGHPRLSPQARRSRDRHAGGPARGQGPACPGPRDRRRFRSRCASSSSARGRNASASWIPRGDGHGGSPPSARLPARSASLYRPVRHPRALLEEQSNSPLR